MFRALSGNFEPLGDLFEQHRIVSAYCMCIVLSNVWQMLTGMEFYFTYTGDDEDEERRNPRAVEFKETEKESCLETVVWRR